MIQSDRLPKITMEGINKQEKRYVLMRLIYRSIILTLGIVAWVLLFFVNWKIAVLLLFIFWGQNEGRK